jgi:hypothetical protein
MAWNNNNSSWGESGTPSASTLFSHANSQFILEQDAEAATDLGSDLQVMDMETL